MNVQSFRRFLFAAAVSVSAFGWLLPSGVYAANEGGGPSTGTLIGSVTCGADEVTPAGNALVSVSGLSVQTRADNGGRFTLTDVPAGQQLRVDAANDPQQSSMNSRFNVVAQAGQTLDVGSIDIAVCPSPSAPAADVPSENDIEQRANPN
jgi:hypothetical protein